MFGFFEPKWPKLLPKHLQEMITNDQTKKSLNILKKSNRLTDNEFASLIINSHTAMLTTLKSNFKVLVNSEPGHDMSYYSKKVAEDRVLKMLLAYEALKKSGQLSEKTKTITETTVGNIDNIIEASTDFMNMSKIFSDIWAKSDNSELSWKLIKEVDNILETTFQKS